MLFHQSDKKRIESKIKSIHGLTPVESAASLLAEPRRQALITNIQTASGFETARIQQLCVPLLQTITHYVQALPDSANSYYAEPHGMLDGLLNRTEAAVNLFRDHLTQGHDAPLSEIQQLWMYTLLSAALLQGIGKLLLDYAIDRFDANAQPMPPWQGLLEALSSSCSYYRHDFIQNTDTMLRAHLSAFLARQCMPPEGFAWIAANHELFSIWLALLTEEDEGGGILQAILERANAIALQRYISGIVSLGQPIARTGAGRMITFIDTGSEISVHKERVLGAEFIQWLTKALASGDLVINKDALVVTQADGKLLISTEVFKRFAEIYKKNAQAVQQAFASWKIHEPATDGGLISRAQIDDTREIAVGIKMDSRILPETVHVYDNKTGHDISQTALAFEQSRRSEPVKHLNPLGQWEPIESKMPWMIQGTKPRG